MDSVSVTILGNPIICYYYGEIPNNDYACYPELITVSSIRYMLRIKGGETPNATAIINFNSLLLETAPLQEVFITKNNIEIFRGQCTGININNNGECALEMEA